MSIRRKTSQTMIQELPEEKTRSEIRRELERLRQQTVGIVPESLAAAAAPSQREKIGDFVGLCLLIEFPDVPATITREEVEAFCNQPGYNGFGNNGSVFDYFRDNSADRLRYTNIVTPYYMAKHNRDHYIRSELPFPRAAHELLREALEWLRTQAIDLSRLSVDSQQCVFATNVFYTGSLITAGLWPHFGILSGNFELTPGKFVADYQISNMGQELTLGTFCHENGHMICDFPDLYDRVGVNSHGVGGFCLMGHGATINEKNPPQINAYLKFRAGWANSVTEITTGLHSVPAGINDFFIRRKNEQEYFIIENRQRIGRDQALRGAGLAIWHIDELGNNQHQDMTPAKHYECSLEQADGEFDLERLSGDTFGEAKDLFHGAGTTSFGESTIPDSRWWDGSSSGLNISNISENDVVMTFMAEV